MATSTFHNVFVGAETGLLKGVHVDKRSSQNLTELQSTSRQNEITTMCWADGQQSKILLGRRNQAVLTYDVESGGLEETLQLSGGKGTIRGLAVHDECVVSCVESGHLQVWRDQEAQLTIEAGENVYRMRQSPGSSNLIATGGKENDLKLWDLHQPSEAIYKAKNVRNDWLNLRVPIWITDIAFLEDSQKMFTSTGHHQVRLYDPGASQRRPVLDMTFDEYPITCMALRPGGNQVVVGNTHGNMALLDVRKGREVQRYKGFAGAIRCLQCHPTLPVVASCGLDRFLRVHDLESKQIEAKIYLKSRLNCLLLTDQWTVDTDLTSEPQNVPEENTAHSDDSGNESQDDELWGKMDVVKTKKLKRKPKYDHGDGVKRTKTDVEKSTAESEEFKQKRNKNNKAKKKAKKSIE